MVHTASLILDDLPCMDDARTRRGRPTCHVAHGEATAILAAFALQNRAFEILGEGWPAGPDAATRSGLIRDLAVAIGLDGMIAGQAKDLEMTDRVIDFQTLEFIHSRKTGASSSPPPSWARPRPGPAPAERAAVVGLREEPRARLPDRRRPHRRDGGAAEAGKDVGKDVKKTTFVSFSGVDGATELARELIAASQRGAPLGSGPRAEPLRDLARYVVTRRS